MGPCEAPNRNCAASSTANKAVPVSTRGASGTVIVADEGDRADEHEHDPGAQALAEDAAGELHPA